MSASGPQRVRSFVPLERLKELHILSAYTMMPEDRDFSPFEHGNSLEYLHLGDWLTLEQRAELVARDIAERGELFQTPVNCARCSGFRVYLYGLSTRRKWHCTECDKELIAGHRVAFAGLVAAAKERLGESVATRYSRRRGK